MDIITINTEITDKDKIDNKLSNEFKFKAEGNFAKIILDFINEGNEIRIKSFKCIERTIDSKENYVCAAEIVIKKTLDKKGRLMPVSDMTNNLILKDNKLIIERKIPDKLKEVIQ